ncbi:assembly, mitochondrial proton-transport ATP synth complex domain-containing protein [Ditylenchus destructor]|uniref:Assembly, mitochondrial proton-transport ATP synth complex domain-containing protein n=1 Tax=Ditylenchus destructor TaxID=166010 RepID=A0AAD4RCC7_9BILA|nr:assembly, mitochondrial proton-transport ATP synth complex domain-containing protein [Ditylenchus destructor]
MGFLRNTLHIGPSIINASLSRIPFTLGNSIFQPIQQCLRRSSFDAWRTMATTSKDENSLHSGVVKFKQIPASDLGESILHLKANSGVQTTTDSLRRAVVIAKFCSLGSSAVGLMVIPILSAKLWENALYNPSTLVFVVLMNAFIGLLTFTPLLLHFLTKRFVADMYYNSETQVFTWVYYSFFLQKHALRFRVEEIVDAAIAPQQKKLWIPLATCFIRSRPVLLFLDKRQYRNQEAFDLLTKNINIPQGHD